MQNDEKNTNKIIFIKTYPEIAPTMNMEMVYIPKIYGFKIYKKKGSKYNELTGKNKEEISFYSEQNLKKMKGLYLKFPKFLN